MEINLVKKNKQIALKLCLNDSNPSKYTKITVSEFVQIS